MLINVTRVENNNSVKYGKRKILHVDDGTSWNVAEKKPFYNSVTGPGMYEVEMAEFQGKPYIKYLKPANAGAKPATGATVSTVAKPSTGIDYKAKLEQDKARQDDIRLEFYCGLVKDIMIANKKKDEDISLEKVQDDAYALFKRHLRLLELASVAGQEKPAEMKPAYQKASEELAKAEAAEEEVPF